MAPMHQIGILSALTLLLAAGASVLAAELPPREAGQRYGQAQSATRICPGAYLTERGLAFPSTVPPESRAEFDAGRDEVTSAWAKAFDCVDTDPEMQRELACRKMKILSCNAAWSEIGPEGTALPGLIDFRAPE